MKDCSKVVKYFAVLLVILACLTPATTWAWDILDGPEEQEVYTDWEQPNDWKIVEAYADVSGVRHLYSPSPDTTLLTHQAVSFGLSYDDWRQYLTVVYIPASRYHKIRVEAASIPSNIRLTDPRGYDNSESAELPPELQYALDIIWEFIMEAVDLPIPSPWQLVNIGAPSITIVVDPDSQGGEFRYNYDPELMGADYAWLIDPPVNTGWYLIDVYAKAEAGLLICNPPDDSEDDDNQGDDDCQGDENYIDLRNVPEITLPDTTITYTAVGRIGDEYRSDVTHQPLVEFDSSQLHSCVFVKEADINIWLWADFEVYR
ncbi:hypothetical protein DRO58_01665 [Candidatus Bathyarchaeota archaeon]|nr:MAG: hypothetical protein DRO58_01665 [Candidatus Bathyarchaeota archaeon]